MKYKDMDEGDLGMLVVCEGCYAAVPYWDKAKHDMWHEKIENHTHTYSAIFGPGSHWNEAGPARDHNCSYADDPRRCAWPGHRK